MHKLITDWTAEEQLALETTFITQVGLTREHNEDRIAVISSAEHGVPDMGSLLMVADGMGGTEAGERASAILASELPAVYFESETKDTAQALVESVLKVHERIFDFGKGSQFANGTGATLVVCVIVNDQLISLNVGDSRAYLHRNGKLTQLSKDHSLRSEFFSLYEARSHSLSHVLTQAIGTQSTINPFVSTTQIVPGDLILLCSDGLTSAVTDIEIEKVLNCTSFTDGADRLLDEVVAKLGDDDTSIILSQVAGGGVRHEAVG